MTFSNNNTDHSDRSQVTSTDTTLTALAFIASRALHRTAERIDTAIRLRHRQQTLQEMARLPAHLRRDLGVPSSLINFSEQ